MQRAIKDNNRAMIPSPDDPELAVESTLSSNCSAEAGERTSEHSKSALASGKVSTVLMYED